MIFQCLSREERVVSTVAVSIMQFSFLFQSNTRSSDDAVSHDKQTEETSMQPALFSLPLPCEDFEMQKKEQNDEINELTEEIHLEMTEARACICKLERLMQLEQNLSEISRITEDVNSFREWIAKTDELNKSQLSTFLVHLLGCMCTSVSVTTAGLLQK